MKYPYIVKHDGVWYPVGAEVPEGGTKAPEKAEPKKVEEPVQEAGITKTEVLRMSRSEVVKLAEENGIEVSEEVTARELKDEIIRKLGL